MLTTIHMMTNNEIYHARFELAGCITQARGLEAVYKQSADRTQLTALRQEIDAAEARLLTVTRPR